MKTKITLMMEAGRKDPVRDMSNKKPYRTVSQRAYAHRIATRGDDTVFRAPTAPVSYHPTVK